MEWSTIISLLVAAAAAFVSYLVYKENSSPDVIVYLEQNEDAKSLLNLVIKNIGKSAARDIKFEYDKKIPQHAFERRKQEDMAEGALLTGIPFLAPGASRIFIYGDYSGIKKFFGDEKIKFNISFFKANSMCPLLWKNPIENESYIELFSFTKIEAADNSHLYRIAQHLKDTSNTLEKISEILNKIKEKMGTD